MCNANSRKLIANVNEQVLSKLNPLGLINLKALGHFSLFSRSQNLTIDTGNLVFQKQLALGLCGICGHRTKLGSRRRHLPVLLARL
jgi:hypothetical protein